MFVLAGPFRLQKMTKDQLILNVPLCVIGNNSVKSNAIPTFGKM